MSELERKTWAGVEAIYRQEPTKDVAGCTIIEVTVGPKAYLRVFDGFGHIEWGWMVRDESVKIWPPSTPSGNS